DEHDAKLLQERLVMGMDVNLERSHDLSAVIHAVRLPEGRVQITVMPLLYGSYAVTRAPGTFSLEPPADLNLAAGWPVFKSEMRQTVENRYNGYRSRITPAISTLPIVGLPPAKTAPPPEDALVRVEPAVPLEEEPPPPSLRARRKGTLVKSGEKVATAHAAGTPLKAPRAEPVTDADTLPNETMSLAAASPSAPPMIRRALPVTSSSPAVALTSATGATWKTFAPGGAPAGRLLDTAGLGEVANNGTRGERVYLKGQFVVNFADANRAVLRPTSGQSGAPARNLRVIADYTAGVSLPNPGSAVSRDESRPYEITEVRRQSDGQLNVFVREISRP